MLRWKWFLSFILLLPVLLHAKTIGYTYDAAGRLIAVTYNDATVIYDYDAAGNVLQKEVLVSRPSMQLSLSTVQFADTTVGQTTTLVLTLSNNGNADLQVSDISSSDPTRFTLAAGNCASLSPILVPASSCQLELVFTPLEAIAYSASLDIASNDPLFPGLALTLSGMGLADPGISGGGANIGGGGGSDPVPAVITGSTDNTGQRRVDVSIGTGGTLSGGTLAGVITNSGLISDVLLDGGARVTGGTLSGTVSGSEAAPALLSNTAILQDSVLRNVILGNGVTLEAGVQLLAGVRFLDNATVPANVDLSTALPQLPGLAVIDLSSDVVIDEASGQPVLSLLGALQDTLSNTTEVPGADLSLQQNSNGALVGSLQGNRFSFLVRQVQQSAGGPENIATNEDGRLQVTTSNGRILYADPQFSDVAVLENSVQSQGFQLLPLANGALLIAPETNPTALSRPVESYTVRAHFESRPAPTSNTPGIGPSTRKLYAGLDGFSLFYELDGELWEQALLPFPLDWAGLKTFLKESFDVQDLRIDLMGIVSGSAERGQFRAVPDYRVFEAAEAKGFSLLNLADENGDGIDDLQITYPDGRIQLFYLLD